MSAEEIGIIILLALVVIGPQRLPEYAEQLGKMVRNVRKMATGATETIREELGDDLADLDLTKFDPRQYDPRRIVREALLEDIVPATKPARAKTAPRTKPVSAGGPTARSTASKTAAKPEPAAAAAVAPADAEVSPADVTEADLSADVDVASGVEAPSTNGQLADAPTDDAQPEGELAAAGVSASPLPPFDDEAT